MIDPPSWFQVFGIKKMAEGAMADIVKESAKSEKLFYKGFRGAFRMIGF